MLCLGRQQSGFVGLKNGGATCYMNAVFQQLFMQPSIRALVLGAREAAPEDCKDSVFFHLQVCPRCSSGECDVICPMSWRPALSHTLTTLCSRPVLVSTGTPSSADSLSCRQSAFLHHV